MAWFNNFSIRTKLLWGFVIVAVLLAGVGLMGIVNANKLGNVAIEVYEANVRPFVVLANLRANTFNTSLMMRDMILLDDKETFQKLQLGIEEIKVKNDKMIQDYKSTVSTLPGENEKMNEFKSKLADFRAVRSQIITLISQGKREEALTLLNTTARERNAATIVVINAIIEMNVRSAEQSAIANKALMSAVQTTLITLVLVGALLAIFIGLVIARGISNPIKHLNEAAKQIAVGNFGVEISSQFQDEVGSLTRSFEEVVGTLNKFAKAQNEMQRQHDAGIISYRIPANGFKGKYAELAEGTNALVKSHIDVKMRVVDVITQYAAGNFAQDMDRLPGEKAKITKSIDDVKASLQSVNSELAMLIDAAQRGNLSVRGDVSKFQYTFREMVGGMNQMLDAIVQPFNEASDVLKQMAEGNLSVKMTGHYQGEYALLKNSLNTTVDLMPFQECIAVLQELSAGNFNVTMQGAYKGDSLALKNALNQTIDSVSQTLAQVIAVVEQVSLGAQQVATAVVTTTYAIWAIARRVDHDRCARLDHDCATGAQGQVASRRSQSRARADDDVAVDQLIPVEHLVRGDIQAGHRTARIFAEGRARLSYGVSTAGHVAGFDVLAVAALGASLAGSGTKTCRAADRTSRRIQPGRAAAVADLNREAGATAVAAGHTGQADRRHG